MTDNELERKLEHDKLLCFKNLQGITLLYTRKILTYFMKKTN